MSAAPIRKGRVASCIRDGGREAGLLRSDMAAAALSQSRHPLIPEGRRSKIDQEGGFRTYSARANATFSEDESASETFGSQAAAFVKQLGHRISSATASEVETQQKSLITSMGLACHSGTPSSLSLSRNGWLHRTCRMWLSRQISRLATLVARTARRAPEDA